MLRKKSATNRTARDAPQRTASNFPFIKKHWVKIPQRKVRRSRCGSPHANRTCFYFSRCVAVQFHAVRCVADFSKLVLCSIAARYSTLRYLLEKIPLQSTDMISCRSASASGRIRHPRISCGHLWNLKPPTAPASVALTSTWPPMPAHAWRQASDVYQYRAIPSSTLINDAPILWGHGGVASWADQSDAKHAAYRSMRGLEQWRTFTPVLTVVFAVHGFAQRDCYLTQTSVSLTETPIQRFAWSSPIRPMSDIRIGRSLVSNLNWTC